MLSYAKLINDVKIRKIKRQFFLGIVLGTPLIIGNINYVENKRVWIGVIFNLHHCPILAIYKVEFFDLSFLPDDG